MGFFDSLLGLGTNKNTLSASRGANGEIWKVQDLNNNLINDATNSAKTSVTQGTNNALGSLASGYGDANAALTGYGQQAQDAVTNGVNSAVGTVQASNGMFEPYVGSGQGANAMLGNALGLNGPSGNAAATSAFQASPGYQWQVDQATDGAARRAASLGMAASGNTLDAITRLGSNLADQQYGSFLDRLQGLSGQGLSAAGAMSANNAQAAGYQYGGAGTLASILDRTGAGLSSNDTSLAANQGNLQSGLGTALGNLDTSRASQQANNMWRGTGMISGNTMNAGQSQDRVDSANNGIFSNLLLGTPSSMNAQGQAVGGSSGLFGTLLSGARSGFKL